MGKNDKKRLFEVFEKVNKVSLKEWYDDEYFAGPEQYNDIDPHDMRQVQEFHTYLTVDGVPDIYEVWKPVWLINKLKNNGYIAEDPQSYAWFFTEEGKQKFPTPEEFQKWMLSFESGEGIKSGDDSEAPYLRGREDSNISM